MSWRRRGLINLFWLTWMFSCGYRTVLIIAYCTVALAVVDGYTWQPVMGYFFALVLGSLDRAWTKAMWPKPHQARAAWAGGGSGMGRRCPCRAAAHGSCWPVVL
jgi:hypothetical protein